MKLVFVCCLLFVINGFSFAQNRYETRKEKLEQLKTRTDIQVTEIEKDILKLEYPHGKVIYKNIADYQHQESSIQQPFYSPTYDSTIIDLTTIDTTLYYHKYRFWQEVPLGNFRTLLVGDVNNNVLPELYGQMKDYTGPYSDIVCFEMNQQGIFNHVLSYDTTVIAKTIYDIDKDGNQELHLIRNLDSVYPGNSYRFYKKNHQKCWQIA